MVLAAIAGAAAKSAAKGVATQAAKTGGRNAARRAASREADKLRKRYRREKESLQKKLDAGTTQKQTERFQKRIDTLNEKIEGLKFNRETQSYDMSKEEISSAEFQSRQSTKKAAASLRMSGMSEQFYADTKDLWAHDKTLGKTTNQKIIDSLNSMNFTEEALTNIKEKTGIDLNESKITELSEAIKVVQALTGMDYLTPKKAQEGINPWDKYKEAEAIRAALSIRSAVTKRKRKH